MKSNFWFAFLIAKHHLPEYGRVDLKLDVYHRRTATSPQPTVIYMHGGFWVAGNKEGAILSLLPWMEMG